VRVAVVFVEKAGLGLLGWWARLLALGVVVLVALVIYTTFPPLVQLDAHFASLADEYPTTRILRYLLLLLHHSLHPHLLINVRVCGVRVRVIRDSWGIAHIFAKTDAEVAFGLAYAHAQDDFTTIQKALLAARGQLSTIEGVGTLLLWALPLVITHHCARARTQYRQDCVHE
jgi:acyl-homoserine lactone acylase PvdQ